MSLDEAVTPVFASKPFGRTVPRQAPRRAEEREAPLQYGWRGAWVVVARGSYDMDSVPALAEALKTAAAKHPKVILDASEVTFADSAFLNVLILAHQAGTLRVVAPSPQVQRLCEITGVDRLLEIRESLDEAAIS
ncbi:STAS domain-containing protein [Streptomyces rishiriensis]|uniref:STAS domain-containing protein n=1 Tax=Streptomyces rishiriensis TaxID=68264 RepID=UPI0037BB0600